MDLLSGICLIVLVGGFIVAIGIMIYSDYHNPKP